jgi:phosphoglycerate kinase
MELPRIQDVKNLKGKRVLVRVDFNVPIRGGKVVDDYRIRRTLPTIEYLKKKGAQIILLAHLGRDPKESLRPVADYFNRQKNFKVGFIPDCLAENAKDMIFHMQEGSVILLENVRQYPNEAANDRAFAKKLAAYGDIYVNDAFAVSHRKQASVAAITQYLPSYAGLLLQDEIKNLQMALHPKHPFLFILGGAKISTKMPLLKLFENTADSVLVGGALANDLLRAKGVEVGKSLIDLEAKNVKKIANHKKVLLPEDVMVKGDKPGGAARALSEIGTDDVIVDVGPKTRASFESLAAKFKFIVINGPLGNYEAGYDKGTKKLLKILSESKAQVIIGGGDTVAMVQKMHLEDSFSFVSTGGGAMLEYLMHGTLPGVEALQKSRKFKS